MLPETQAPAGTSAALIVKKMSPFVFCLREVQDTKFVLKRVLATLFFYTTCLYIMSVSVVYSSMRFPKDAPLLPDVGFDMFPEYNNSMFAHGVLFFCIGYLLVRTLFHPRGITMIRRFAIVHGLCAIMRAITLIAPSYPDPQPACTTFSPPATTGEFWIRTIYYHDVLTCGDLMYSGHTIVYTLVALSAQIYMSTVEKTIAWILLVIGGLALIIVRLHYTNDVIIGFFFAVSTYMWYHLFATNPTYKEKIPPIAWMEEQEECPAHERLTFTSEFRGVKLETDPEDNRDKWR